MEIRILVESLEPENGLAPFEQNFSKLEVAIGRVKTNDLVLMAADVSSKHAKIVLQKTEEGFSLFLTDLGSSNGTFLEDTRIEPNLPVELSPGQRVVIGCFILTPEFEAEKNEIEHEDVFTANASSSLEERIAEMLPEKPADQSSEVPVEGVLNPVSENPVSETPVSENPVSGKSVSRVVEAASVTGVIPRTPEWSYPSMLESFAEEVGKTSSEPLTESSVTDRTETKREEKAALLEALRGLQLVCSRVSHVLRTPLGVAMGTLSDARAAGEVEKQILDDGERAQQLILEKLHFLKLLATQVEGEFSHTQLVEVLQEHFAKRVTVRGIAWSMSLPDSLPELELDSVLLLRALDALIFYLSAKYSGSENSEHSQVVLRVVQVLEEIVVELEFSKPSAAERFVHEGLAKMGDVGHSEHFVESIALVYADLVARLHGGRAEVHVHELNEISLVLVFPL